MKRINKPFIILPILVLMMSFNISNDWYQLNTTEFKILFPKVPNSTTKKVNTEAGEIQMQTYLLDASKDETDENLVYGISTSEYPKEHVDNHKKHDNLLTLFNNTISGMVNSVNGKLISETNIVLGKYPGREIKIDFKNGLAIIKARIYLIDNRAYIIQTITKTEKDNNKSIDKFMNSFNLKKG